MINVILLQKMITEYNNVAYTHLYIFGFIYKKNVYMAHATVKQLPYLLKLDKASRGAGYALRFCPNTEQKIALLPQAILICSVEYFTAEVEKCKYNKGEVFEKMVTEYYGQQWKKDNIPFTQAGDIEINGTAYQIKFEKATFCNEKSLANLR